MFKKMAVAVFGQAMTDLNLVVDRWNVTSRNFETWMALQKAVDALAVDDRYEVLVWTCRHRARLHSGGLVEVPYQLGMDIIKNNVAVVLERNPKNGKRCIFIRIGYARELPSPATEKKKSPKNRHLYLVENHGSMDNIDRRTAEGEMLEYIHSWFEFQETGK